jgi:small glutamine-rich tetratricopeptide repeat-containing protein alpha
MHCAHCEVMSIANSTCMQASAQDTKKRLALAIIDFLSTSLKDGTISSEDAESVEVAQSCIADTFHVDPSDKKAMEDAIGTQSLLSIYGVYEKLKGKSTASTSGASSATEGRPATPQTPGGAGAKPASNPEAEAFKSKGNQAMQAKDYKSAIDMYSKALNISPLNPIYLSNRAAAYSASSQHSEASTDAEMAVAADPKYTKAWSRLGLARFALGDAKGSMEAYQKGIEYEGSGGSEAMKRGFETAKKKVEEEEDAGGEMEAEASRGGSGAGAGAGAGGMPDLSALAGMFGGGGGRGGGGPDLSSIMSNPMFASMAQNLMSNPDMMNNIMSNPRLRQMAESFGGGGGGGGGEGGRGGGGGGGGMPDIASLMQDPSIAEM